MKIKDIPTVVHLFEVAATNHTEATKYGDYKTGNKNYKQVLKAVSFLKDMNSIDELLPFLSHNEIGVRLIAATFLLPTHTEEANDIIEEISKSSDFFSFMAQVTLAEWRKGSLVL